MRYLDRQTRKKLQNYYEILRTQAQKNHQRELEQLYQDFPCIREFEQKKIDLKVKLVKSKINRSQDVESINQQLDQVREQFAEFLHQNNIPVDYENIHYYCTQCEDTGWYQGDYCQCVNQVLTRLNNNNTNFMPPSDSHFNNFDVSVFSDEKNTHYFQGKLSPQEAIKGIRQLSETFTNRFNQSSKNIYLFGAPGTGKTFVMGCIANELLEQGKYVVYLKAVRLFEIMAKRNTLLNSYSPDPEEQDSILQFIDSIRHAELLCIDDLGMEANAYKSAYADFIVLLDERMDHHRSTIITSNLRPKDLGDEYDERIRSRITGNFDLIMFEGEDVRNRIAGLKTKEHSKQ